MDENTKVLTLPGLTHYDEKIKEYINEQDSQIIPPNIIYVSCDGSRDELKIQAALNTVSKGGTVYVTGAAVLTNTESQNAVISVPGYATLDFSNCEYVTFNNISHTDNQVIFYMSEHATLRGIRFSLESGTETNPRILETATYCLIDKCEFTDIGTFEDEVGYNMPMFYLGSYSMWHNSTIDTVLINYGEEQHFFYAGTETDIVDSKFSDFTQAASQEDNQYKVFQLAARARVVNCRFQKIKTSKGRITIAANASLTRSWFGASEFAFYSTGRAELSKNTFTNTTLSHDVVNNFSLSGNSNGLFEFNGNKFISVTVTGDWGGSGIFIANAEMRGNTFEKISVSGATAVPYIFIYDGVNVCDNTFVGSTNGAETFIPLCIHDGCVVMNNITNTAQLAEVDADSYVMRNNVVNGVFVAE